MNDTVKHRIIADAKDRLSGFDILFDHYTVWLDNLDEDTGKCDVVFENSTRYITLREVWYNANTGEILQAGINRGELVA